MSTLILPAWIAGTYLKVGGVITATTVSISGGIIFTTVEKKQPFITPFINKTSNAVKDSIKNYVSFNPAILQTVKSGVSGVKSYISNVPQAITGVKNKTLDLMNDQVHKQITNIPYYFNQTKDLLKNNLQDAKIKEYSEALKQQFDNASQLGKDTQYFFEKTLMGYGKNAKKWLIQTWDTQKLLQYTGNIFTTVHQKPKELSKALGDAAVAVWKEKTTFLKFAKWLDSEKISVLWNLTTSSGDNDLKKPKKNKKTSSKKVVSSNQQTTGAAVETKTQESPVVVVPAITPSPQKQTSSSNTETNNGVSREGDPSI